MDRYGRQKRLAEVGGAGQARIGAAHVTLGLGGVSAVLAARYLAGAGVGELRVMSPEVAARARAVNPDALVLVDASAAPSAEDGERVEPALSPFALRDPAADAVALGALTALRALRRALGVGA